MPIYEYQCKSCGVKFEKLVRSMSAVGAGAGGAGEPKVQCPKCGSDQTAKALSVFAVGAEGSAKGTPESAPMCGRCGGPGPCAMG